MNKNPTKQFFEHVFFYKNLKIDDWDKDFENNIQI
jgi:hypothetical protein